MSQSAQDILAQALRFHRAGQILQVRDCYNQVLAEHPDHADALNLLGYATHQAGDPHEALRLIRKSIVLNGSRADYHCNLGVVLAGMHQHREAIDAFRAALAIRPDLAEASYNLGVSLHAIEHRDERLDAYRAALAIKPAWAEAWINLGNTLMDLDRFQEALDAFRKAAELNPQMPAAWFNQSNALMKLERFQEGIVAAKQTIALQPVHAKAYNNLGSLYAATKRHNDAIAAFLCAIEQNPNYADAFGNLANAYQATENYPKAIAAARSAISLDPNHAQAHANLAHAFLATHQRQGPGHLPTGHPNRFRVARSPLHPRRHAPRSGRLSRRLGALRMALASKGIPQQPPAVKSPLMERRTHPRQKDSPPDRAGIWRPHPVCPVRPPRCPARSHGLFGNSPRIGSSHGFCARCRKSYSARCAPPETELRCPLLSLPRIFGTTIETIPSKVPYLWFDPKLADKWRDRLGDEKRLKVGLVWTGRPRPEPRRSVPIDQLAPLANVDAVRFISLQYGDAAAQAKNAPAGLVLEDFNSDISDFADTAALMANLDLIITIDTAAAHLAGAGKARLGPPLRSPGLALARIRPGHSLVPDAKTLPPAHRRRLANPDQTIGP